VLGVVLNAVNVRAKGYYYYYYPHDMESSKVPEQAERGQAGGEAAGPETSRSEIADGAFRRRPSRPPARRRQAQRGRAQARPPRGARARRLRAHPGRHAPARDGKSWKSADREFRIAPGEVLRTSADGAALLTFPWMQIVVANDTVVGLTPSQVLSATLERGRIQEQATAGDILKVVTAEAEVRGRGDVVVIRSESPAVTRVSLFAGWFRVKSPRECSPSTAARPR
jgi:hypothetical protein